METHAGPLLQSILQNSTGLIALSYSQKDTRAGYAVRGQVKGVKVVKRGQFRRLDEAILDRMMMTMIKTYKADLACESYRPTEVVDLRLAVILEGVANSEQAQDAARG